MALQDFTRRSVPSSSAGICHPSFELTLVDECVRTLKERGGLQRALLPTVQLPGLPATIPPVLLTKLLSNSTTENLRRFDLLNAHLDTQPLWKGLCKRDFPAAFEDKSCLDAREYYDLLASEHRTKEARIKRTLQEGVMFVKKRAEVRKTQSVDPSILPISECSPSMPFLARRTGTAHSFHSRPGRSLRANVPETKPHIMAQMLGSKTLSKKEALRLAAGTAQAQLRNRYSSSLASDAPLEKRPRS